jgi:hypothetical protein
MKNKRLYLLLAFAALALASPCQAQQTSRQQNSTPQQALDKRQDAFQADKAKGVHEFGTCKLRRYWIIGFGTLP